MVKLQFTISTSHRKLPEMNFMLIFLLMYWVLY